MPRIDFIGKGDVAGHHLGVPFHGLKIDKSKSVGNADIDDNLIIQGDNLLALKALLPRYAGKVKCIYIDPPYNTGNEGWVYNDKVNSPTLKNWYKKVVGGDDQCRHDKWLCMMYPRLQLLKELLSDDGVIFISCDDNEQHRLRFIMDEVFGEENFVENFTVRANPRGNQAKRLTASEHEYVISCAKNKSLVSPLSFEKSKEEFKKKDKNGYYRELGLRKRGAGARRQDAENQYYPIYFNKDTEEISTKNKKNFIKILPYLSNGEEGRWRWSKSNVEENKDRLMVRLVNRRDSDKSYDVFEKEYFSENRKTKIKSILYEKWVNYENATEELKIIFGKEKVFDYTKPHLLIKELLKAATEQGDIILDSFAGSGTTAHATLALNKEDGGNRKFILVECEDYANKIAAERIRRVIKG
ncbi:MAG: site-specific DNA-methyltransferase, partial [Candidatus Oxydemutatoraceae bacterium WSBS_2016_MAG_OTU14]